MTNFFWNQIICKHHIYECKKTKNTVPMMEWVATAFFINSNHRYYNLFFFFFLFLLNNIDIAIFTFKKYQLLYKFHHQWHENFSLFISFQKVISPQHAYLVNQNAI